MRERERERKRESERKKGEKEEERENETPKISQTSGGGCENQGMVPLFFSEP